MAKLKHLSEEEVQQITFDWRYRGFTVLDLLTEEECDEINAELETLRQARIGTTTEDGKEWGDWDPFSYPHKISAKLEKLFCHPNAKISQLAQGLSGHPPEHTQPGWK